MDKTIQVHILYNSGKFFIDPWLPGSIGGIGQKDLAIKKVTVSVNGKQLFTFTNDDFSPDRTSIKDKRVIVWNITENGICPISTDDIKQLENEGKLKCKWAQF